MNSSYNTGAIGKMMILNVLLVVIIATVVIVLLFPKNKEVTTVTAVPGPSEANSAKTSQTEAPDDTQAEIDALKKQLERETSNLQTLRTQEQRIEMIRKQSELEAAKQLELQVLEPENTPTEPDQNETVDSAGTTPEIPATAKNPVE